MIKSGPMDGKPSELENQWNSKIRLEFTRLGERLILHEYLVFLPVVVGADVQLETSRPNTSP